MLKRLGVTLSDEAVEIVSLPVLDADCTTSYLDAMFAVNLGDPLERLHLDRVDKTRWRTGWRCACRISTTGSTRS